MLHNRPYPISHFLIIISQGFFLNSSYMRMKSKLNLVILNNGASKTITIHMNKESGPLCIQEGVENIESVPKQNFLVKLQ